MPKASDVKRGDVVRHKGRVFAVGKIEIRTPSSRGSNTLYKMKLRDVQTRQNYDETFKGEDLLDDVDFTRRQASYSYFDGELYVFMDDEDYSQYSFNEADLEGQLEYLTEGLGGIYVTVIDGFAKHRQPETCRKVAVAYRKRLRFLLLHEIQVWAWNSKWVDKYPDGGEEQREYRRTNLYSNHPLIDTGTWMPYTPTLEVGGVRFGTDKLAHLVSSGWTYYKEYYRGISKGQTPDELYAGTGDNVVVELAQAREKARQERIARNRVADCSTCPRVA